MARRKADAPTRISIMIPADLLAEVDSWKTEIENISRSELLSKLARFALDHNAIDRLYPDHTGGMQPRLAGTPAAQTPAPAVDNGSRKVRSTPPSPRPTPEPMPRPSLEQDPGSSGHSEPVHSHSRSMPLNGNGQAPGTRSGPVTSYLAKPSTPIPGDPEPRSGRYALVGTHTSGGTNTLLRMAPGPDRGRSSSWSISDDAGRPVQAARTPNHRGVMTPDEFVERITRLQQRVERI